MDGLGPEEIAALQASGMDCIFAADTPCTEPSWRRISRAVEELAYCRCDEVRLRSSTPRNNFHAAQSARFHHGLRLELIAAMA